METNEIFNLSDEELLVIKGRVGDGGTIIVNCTKEDSGYFENDDSNIR